MNGRLACIQLEMTTLEASLVEKVRVYTREAIADIFLGHSQVDGSEGDKPLPNFVKRIVRSDIMSI